MSMIENIYPNDETRFPARIEEMMSRIAVLERLVKRAPLGFRVMRSTNDSALATGNTRVITWNSIIDNSGVLPAGWSTGQTFTVPPGGGGVWFAQAMIWYSAALTGVLMGIRRNGGTAIAAATSNAESNDRIVGSGIARLAAGDTLDVFVNNISGSSITITTYAGDGNSVPMPMFSAYRVG